MTRRSAPAAPGFPGRALRLVAYWAPVWVPLVLLWQVAMLGWKPARLEGERLERERGAVTDRYESTRARYERMEAEVAAWGDPMYRARLREILQRERGE